VGKTSFIYRYMHNDFTDTLSVSNHIYHDFFLLFFFRLSLVHMFLKNGSNIIFPYG
jgi:GTPase SAR1 family protein